MEKRRNKMVETKEETREIWKRKMVKGIKQTTRG
jgi:hypothetical protein